jgi:hypothetical protein
MSEHQKKRRLRRRWRSEGKEREEEPRTRRRKGLVESQETNYPNTAKKSCRG